MNIIFTGVINPLRKPGCGAHTLESHNCQQLSGMQLKKKRIKINSKEKKKTSSPPNLKKYSILLADIMNTSLTTGVVPDSWKCATNYFTIIFYISAHIFAIASTAREFSRVTASQY
jgi:hypothetical protein